MAVARRGSSAGGRRKVVKLEPDHDGAPVAKTLAAPAQIIESRAGGIAVHAEDAGSLVACAVASRSFPDLEFSDPLAEQILAELDLEPARFDERSLRASIVRTMVVDELVREFFERHPSGLAVSLLPGLCTRFSRIDNGALRWLDLEPAEIAAFKRELFHAPERHIIATCCSIECSGWMKLLADAGDMPVLLVAQGGFRRAPIDVRDAFFTNAAVHLPTGTEIVIEYDAHAPLRPSSLRDACASLSTPDVSGEWAIYPRIRFVRPSEHSQQIEHRLAGVNAVSRLFRGRGAPSIAHLRFT